jgi:hypothetical protein
MTLALAMIPLGVMSLTAAGAQATQVEYLNKLLPAGYLWSGFEWHTKHMISDTVYYSGAGTVSVCEKVNDLSVGWVSSKCGNQFAEATPAELERYLGHAMEPWAVNNSGNAHTIHGVWVE